MLVVKYTRQFKKDYKLMQKRGLDTDLLKKVVLMLANEEKLAENYKDHNLTGKYKRL